jgi:NitT/TauT family transport system permease protein
MFGGFKLAAIFAVVGAVVGEFIGADKGLGRTLLLANGQLNTRLLFATIGYLTIFGVLFYLVIEIAERISLPWHVSKRTT